MSPAALARREGMLVSQLRWLTRLRWLVGAAVITGGAFDQLWLDWFDRGPFIMAVGAVILAYNVVFLLALRKPLGDHRAALRWAWAQILLDLVCLTVLAVWTGGTHSPVLGFFVFHMVFASMMLTRPMAYAVAAAAILMLPTFLIIAGHWPSAGAGQLAGRPPLILGGWCVTLILTVFLTNRITSSMRVQSQRMRRKNRRIRALAEGLRRQQQVMVQHEKSVTMGQMAAGVAHEIANPLASMDGVLQLLQRNSERVTPERVDQLRHQVQRIKQIVHLMTNFAHPTEYRWETVRLDELAESCLEMARFDRRCKLAVIERQFTAGPCSVHVQPHAVQQALVNVLFNALDAVVETSQPRLLVTTECRDGLGRISVIDNGPGIKPENLKRIFEPFFTTKPVGKGTGLGLTITESLIRNQGGLLEVESQIDQGTRVTLVLPGQRRTQ